LNELQQRRIVTEFGVRNAGAMAVGEGGIPIACGFTFGYLFWSDCLPVDGHECQIFNKVGYHLVHVCGQNM